MKFYPIIHFISLFNLSTIDDGNLLIVTSLLDSLDHLHSPDDPAEHHVFPVWKLSGYYMMDWSTTNLGEVPGLSR